ncbi:MAG TPA: efflux RND transporter periplasmic adaptor subunit [Terriglobales bacterium]|nr:efflux RND transporter periplasmic adaptor subunit [Terriglobales bacterium]
MDHTLKDLQHDEAATHEHRARRAVGVLVIGVLVLLVVALFSIAQRRAERRVLAKQTEQMAVPYVSVIHATPESGESELVLPATIEAYVQSPIYARTNGYLKAWYKDIGSRVKKGELLAEIDTPEVDQQLAQARAELTTAKANAQLAAVTAERYQGLLNTDSVSKQEVDNALGDNAAKQAAVQSAEANVKRLAELESFKHVYAPFSGVVTRRNVDIGYLINAGGGSGGNREMFDLSQTDPLRVYVSVPQSDSGLMRRGLKACLQLTESPGRSFCGQVVRTADAIDPSTRTLLTEVDVPNATGALMPGAYAEVHFAAESATRRLNLPINALLFRPQGTLAAVVGPDNRIRLQSLTIGRDFGSSVEVLAGLTQEDAVVINPPDSLEAGESVMVKSSNAQPSQAPAAQDKQE